MVAKYIYLWFATIALCSGSGSCLYSTDATTDGYALISGDTPNVSVIIITPWVLDNIFQSVVSYSSSTVVGSSKKYSGTRTNNR
jgi:hypothetical protein